MKKYLSKNAFVLIAVSLLTALLAISLSSCGEDETPTDPTGGGGGGSSLNPLGGTGDSISDVNSIFDLDLSIDSGDESDLVGTWEMINDNGTNSEIFNSDGSYAMSEMGHNYTLDGFSYNASTKLISISNHYATNGSLHDAGDWWVYKYFSVVDGNKLYVWRGLVISGTPGAGKTFKAGAVEVREAVDNGTNESHVYLGEATFNADGTFTEIGYEYEKDGSEVDEEYETNTGSWWVVSNSHYYVNRDGSSNTNVYKPVTTSDGTVILENIGNFYKNEGGWGWHWNTTVDYYTKQ